MTIGTILTALAAVYEETFPQNETGERIKRVTAHVPEQVHEWPWLYFVVEAGEIRPETFQAALPSGFGGTARRSNYEVVHRFKAQLLVRPRRNLAEDEPLVRALLAPVLLAPLEDVTLGGAARYCYPTGYRYGRLTHGQVEYAGLEVMFEAAESL